MRRCGDYSAKSCEGGKLQISSRRFASTHMYGGRRVPVMQETKKKRRRRKKREPDLEPALDQVTLFLFVQQRRWRGWGRGWI